ncbi:MAG TPA: hypothetical protein VKI62_09230 [Bacteroidota bacterium]|nr:hypothetical protein [Bacteroidota bacterium]
MQSINTGTEVATGTEGYIVGFDMKANRMQKVTQIMVQRNGVNSVPVIAQTNMNALYGYLENPSCPILAFAVMNTSLYIFVNSVATNMNLPYPFDGSTLILIEYYRNSIPCLNLTDSEDIPDDAKELFNAQALIDMKKSQGLVVEMDESERLRKAKYDLGLLT